MKKAIEMHLAAMGEDGDEISKPSRFDMVEGSCRLRKKPSNP